MPLSFAKNVSCSITVNSGISGSIYGQYPIRLFPNPLFDKILFNGAPLIEIFPSVINSAAVRHLKVVVLPAPLTPSKIKHSSFFRLNDIP